MSDDLLHEMTGKTSAYWFRRIQRLQRLIRAHTTPDVHTEILLKKPPVPKGAEGTFTYRTFELDGQLCFHVMVRSSGGVKTACVDATWTGGSHERP